MSLVTHKYTPAGMSDTEMEATFAARGHTLDYLLKSLRDQMHSGTLSSFVITGPRGAGKSMVIHMVALRMRQDAMLSAAWIPVMFPEEQFNVASLRDLLAATLRVLSGQGSSAARTWFDQVQSEPNEEQSEQLAITGLKDVTRQVARRLVLFVENLDVLLEECLDRQMKGRLRRLLMIDPFMMLIGSSVHVFDSLRRYDEAFFNYFGQVPLDRLDAEQVFDLLRRRGEFDRNDQFLRELPEQRSKVRAIVHLSGGNPRLVLMLYELLSQRQLTTIVHYLRRMVDELTPLLKDEMQSLPPQQRQIIHALMEKGGTAKPTELASSTRLPLNVITAQLNRLKNAQIVELLGGGKGRAANYTVPDKLSAIWYQMRYLGQNRRRIELFVEVLRIWFEEEERLEVVRHLSRPEIGESTGAASLRERATAAEYFAASLRGTRHERTAADLCIEQYVKLDLREAAQAYAELASATSKVESSESKTTAELALWLVDHGDLPRAVEAYSHILQDDGLDGAARSDALRRRGITKRQQGDVAGAVADYTAVVELPGAPADQVARALGSRGAIIGQQGDVAGALADYTAVVELPGAPADCVGLALVSRGITKEQQGDVAGALADYTAAVELQGAPADQVALALVSRGMTKGKQGDVAGELADRTAVVELPGAPTDQVALALLSRGLGNLEGPDSSIAYADLRKVVEMAVTENGLVVNAADAAFSSLWQRSDAQGAVDIVARLSATIATLPEDRARETAVQFLSRLASPEMKVAWPIAWRVLAENATPATRESIELFRPVCALLDGQPRAVLDALPPEQRDFVSSVLARFDQRST